MTPIVQRQKALVVTRNPEVVNWLTPLLHSLFARCETDTSLPPLTDPVPGLVVLDFFALPLTPAGWRSYAEAGSRVLLLIPPDHEAALLYALQTGPDEFASTGIDSRELLFRIRRLLPTLNSDEDDTNPSRRLLKPLASPEPEAVSRIKQRLTQLQQRFRLINRLTPTHVFASVFMPDRSIRRIEADEVTLQEICGYTFEEMEALGGWLAIVHPDDVQVVREYYAFVGTGQEGGCEYRVRHATGIDLWLREYSIPIMHNGQMVQVEGVIQDFTRLKIARSAEATQRGIIHALYLTSMALNSSLNSDEVLDQILTSLEKVLPCELADVMLVEAGIARIVRHRGYVERGLDNPVDALRLPVHQYPGLSRMAETLTPLLISDTRNSIWTPPNPQMDWVRSYIGAPLIIQGRFAGVLNLNSSLPGRFTSADLERLEIFASQVSIAITNARMHDVVLSHSEELEQRLRDLVIVYEIGHALNSTLDLQEIYTALYQQVVEQIYRVHRMEVYLPNTEGRLVCNYIIENGHPLDPRSMLLTPELSDQLEVIARHPETIVSRNTVLEPLLSQARLTGIWRIIGPPEMDFEWIDTTMMSIVASVAAISIENARLYQTVNYQRDEMIALYNATTSLLHQDNLEALTQEAVRTVLLQFNHTDAGILELNPETNTLKLLARGSYGQRVREQISLDEPGLIPIAVQTGEMIYAPDVARHPAYFESDPRTRSELVIPLRFAGKLLGVLDLQSPQVNAFTEQDRRVLTAFAERLGMAMQNVRLMEQIRRHADKLEQVVNERTQELRQALAEERKLRKVKTRFLKTVSHEFRTPLTVIQSASEMLTHYGDRMSPDQRTLRYDMIRSGIQTMVEMLADASTLNRLLEDDAGLKAIRTELISLTGEIIADVAAGIGKDHRILYDSDSKEAPTIIDIELWRKVVSELVGNAIHYSAPGTTITCEFAASGSEYAFSVTDQGMGIPPEDQERVWEMFDRGGNVENIPGTGLGLAIVRQSIERYGGRTFLRSEPGTGTTVTVYLPRMILEGVE